MHTPVPLSWYRKFFRVVSALEVQGWCVVENFWPEELIAALRTELYATPYLPEFREAGMGREADKIVDTGYRSDRMRWLTGRDGVETQYLGLMAVLQRLINRRLYLGLADFECQFSIYPAGGFYRRHMDGFRDYRARVVTVISYLNPGWLPAHGGALVLYDPQQPDKPITEVTPRGGTFVVFLSEVFPHEVLAARRERCSVAGWFRVRDLG